MSIIKKDILYTVALANEVIELAAIVTEEIDDQATWNYETRKSERKWAGKAPDNERHPGYTKASAALKRRSLDLTRALASMRKGDAR